VFTARYGLTVQPEFSLISVSKSSITPQLHRFPDAVSCPRKILIQDDHGRHSPALRDHQPCAHLQFQSPYTTKAGLGGGLAGQLPGAPTYTALRRHCYNRKHGSRKSRLPHAEEFLPGTTRNFGMRPHKRSPALFEAEISSYDINFLRSVNLLASPGRSHVSGRCCARPRDSAQHQLLSVILPLVLNQEDSNSLKQILIPVPSTPVSHLRVFC